MKWSAFTLVSRDNELMGKSVAAMAAQEPDEYVGYIDTVALPDHEKAIRILEEHGAEAKFQEIVYKDDHYINPCLNVYRAILDARHPWVQDCDDDDEVIGNIREDMLPFTGPDVGAVYGHKIRRKPDGELIGPILSWDIYSPFEIAGMRGSLILYNQEAFREIYQNIDLFRGRIDDSYGYFWEYKIMYWMLRAGYTGKSCGKVVMLQNLNMERPPKVKELQYAWYPMVVKNRDKLELLR